MTKLTVTAAALAAATAATASAQIVDTFEVDTSAAYSAVELGGPDSTSTFAFDYVAAGIPLAPNSVAGTTSGLRMTANDSLGAANALTLFNNVPVAGDYVLSVDVYANVGNSGGTTEYIQVGVGGDGTTGNSIFSPISGSGSFAAFTGDGGSTGSDYRYFIGDSRTTVPSDDPSYLAATGDPLANGGQNTQPLYQDIFPETNGSPTNIWTTVTVTVDQTNDSIVYALDGTPIFDASLDGLSLDGLVSLGYADLFSSVDNGEIFVVYDNLVVSPIAIPEPTTLAALGLAGLGLVRRRRA